MIDHYYAVAHQPGARYVPAHFVGGMLNCNIARDLPCIKGFFDLRTATLEEHTHHKDGSPGSQCVACHMPAIETEGPANTMVHAHTFRFITPAMTDKYKIPNPCTSCHIEKSAAWANEAMSHWPERSPWRLQ